MRDGGLHAAEMYMMQKDPHNFNNRLLLSSNKDYRALEKQQQKADKHGDTAKSEELASQLREMEVKAHTDRHEAQREMAGALLRTGAMVGTGMGVTIATGGAGVVPYLAGMSAASAVSMGLDPEVRTRLSIGDYPGALNHGSYHLPFVGAGRNSWNAWQLGKPWTAAGHAGLGSLEASGLRGVWKLQGAGKVRGTVRGGNVTKGAAKAKKAGDVVKQGKVEGVAKANSSTAKLATNSVKLELQLASEAQVHEQGRIKYVLIDI
jgi:hypothetical protein